MVAPSRRRDAFIRAVEAGKIPTIIPPLPGRSQGVRAHYISLDELQTRGGSLVELFGLTERLVELGYRSRFTRCGGCGEAILVFSSAGEIVEEIARAWHGRPIRVELRGPEQAITTFAKERGWSSITVSRDIATVPLDSFPCEEVRCRQLQPLIASTRRLAGAWIEVRDSTARSPYAWHGRCPSCDWLSPVFRRSLLREALKRGDHSLAPVEMSRLVGECTLSEIVRLPIEELADRPETRDMWPAQQRSAITKLNIGSLTLADRYPTIAPVALARLPLALYAGEEGDSGDIRIIDIPPNLLSSDQERAVQDVGFIAAQGGPMVWLRAAPSEPPSIESPSASSKALGFLSRRNSPSNPLDVRCGEWRAIDASELAPNRRAAIMVADAIEGLPEGPFSFSRGNPFTLHFIPLFSVESSLSRLVAHELGAIEPLAKLFAASHQAKMLGLSHRDFVIGQARLSPSLCGTCRGGGLVLNEEGELLSDVSLCPSCSGTRFSGPGRDVTFKGKTLWQILNSTIDGAAGTLHALPKMGHVVELLRILDLQHIPLGIPTALLPRATRRLFSAIRATVSATTTRPSLIVIEEPFVGLSDQQLSRFTEFVSHPSIATKAAWVGVESLSGRGWRP